MWDQDSVLLWWGTVLRTESAKRCTGRLMSLWFKRTTFTCAGQVRWRCLVLLTSGPYLSARCHTGKADRRLARTEEARLVAAGGLAAGVHVRCGWRKTWCRGFTRHAAAIDGSILVARWPERRCEVAGVCRGAGAHRDLAGVLVSTGLKAQAGTRRCGKCLRVVARAGAGL
jgi:hypothetical protein